MRHAERAAAIPLAPAIWEQVFQRPAPAPCDVDEDLYRGFVGAGDRRMLTQLRTLPPSKLAAATFDFDDRRLEELVFRYRARNFLEMLGESDRERWDQHRAARLFGGEGGARTVDQLFEEIDRLSENADEHGEEILGALYDYAELIAPTRR